jgi:hypothetical protein
LASLSTCTSCFIAFHSYSCACILIQVFAFLAQARVIYLDTREVLFFLTFKNITNSGYQHQQSVPHHKPAIIILSWILSFVTTTRTTSLMREAIFNYKLYVLFGFFFTFTLKMTGFLIKIQTLNNKDYTKQNKKGIYVSN